MSGKSAMQNLLDSANGDDPKKMSAFSRLLMLLFSPGVQNIVAGEEPNSVMAKRSRLISPTQTGGAFDIIYRAKKSREDAMRELLNQ